jgi:phosphoribosylformylglycinamidine (FGAM) synthase-like enzyme
MSPLGRKSSISFKDLSFSAVVEEGALAQSHIAHDEYRRLRRLLGRSPTKLELLMAALIWSERCCQKSTRAHLGKLSVANNAFLLKTNTEWTLAIKMQSSLSSEDSCSTQLGSAFLELIAMGAVPIGFMHSALLGENAKATTRLADYARELSIPGFLGSFKFDDEMLRLNGEALLMLGVLKSDQLVPKRASGNKNRLFYVGLAEQALGAEQILKLKNVFLAAAHSNMLIGAERIANGALAFAAMSLACLDGVGLTLHIDEIKEQKLDCDHIMLAEKPGTLLAVVDQKRTHDFLKLCKDSGVCSYDIGAVNGDGILRVIDEGKEIAHLPVTMVLENAPRLRLGYQSLIPAAKNGTEKGIKISFDEALYQLQKTQSARLDIGYSFDHHLGLNTLLGSKEADGVLLRVPPLPEPIAMTMLCEDRLLVCDPKEGAKRALFEALLRLSILGSSTAFVGCTLWAQRPECEEVMTNIKHIIDSLVENASALGVGIDSWQVALSEEQSPSSMLPRLSIAALGQKPAPLITPRYGNARSEELLILLGDIPDGFSRAEEIFASPEYYPLRSWEMSSLKRLQKVSEKIIELNLCSSMSVVGQGALWNSLIRIMEKSGLGLDLEFGSEWLSSELVISLFSEDSLRIVMSIKEHHLMELKKLCANHANLLLLGHVGGDSLRIRHQDEVIYERSRQEVLVGRYVD